MSQFTDIVKDACATSLGTSAEQLHNLRNSSVTITGGTGFLGTWLTEVLTSLNDHHDFGIQLHLIDREIESFSRISPHLASRSDVHLIEADVRYLSELPRDTQWLIHAAGDPDTRNHFSNPVKTLNLLSAGTQSVFALAEQLPKIRMVLNLSSGLIYGPQPEEMETIPEDYSGAPSLTGLQSVYSEGKRFGEMVANAYRNEARLPTTNVRPFSFIGPFQKLTSPWAATNFIMDSLQDRPIRILGDGTTLRSFMYGSDAAVWLLHMLSRGTSGDIFNLGSSESIDLKSLARKISEQFSNPQPVILSAGGPEAQKRSVLVPSTKKAETQLGLSLRIPFDDAVNMTVKWFKSQHGGTL